MRTDLDRCELLDELSQSPVLEGNPDARAVASHLLTRHSECPPTISQTEYEKIHSDLVELVSKPSPEGDHSKVCEPMAIYGELPLQAPPFPGPKNPKFKFIDLFAGIGGFRIAFQNIGGECVFTSEWDKSAKETYERNFGETPYGDITKIDEKEIPDHDVLCAGFPCQPFSLAGVSARNALDLNHGFECVTQGTLFFDVARIVAEKRPPVVLLENVRNLVSHDKGNTFKVIQKTMKDLGYSFSYQLINSETVVPQKRVRCFMVCLKDGGDFKFPSFEGDPLPLRGILEKTVEEKFTISDRLWEGHQKRTDRNLARGTGFTAFCANLDAPANTIVARYGKDGKECLIPQEGKNPRMLTPRECARVQGFPEDFVIPVAKTSAYRQFGNSVAVPVVEILAQCIREQVDL